MSIINSVLKVFVGDKKKKDLKILQPIVEKVKVFEPNISALSIDELRDKTNQFKVQIKEATKPFKDKTDSLNAEIETANIDRKEAIYKEIDLLKDQTYEASEAVLQNIMPEAFAVVKETAKRFYNQEELIVDATPFDRELSATYDFVSLEGDKAIWKNHWDAMGKAIIWDMIHYDVQLIGGAVLHGGNIAEMMTGEGKTLVATLPIYLNALTGNGVHVVTVNDYLAKRDARWMGPLFQFHGLSIDCIDLHQPNSEERRKAYNADITYGTNNEFGFDYLRDNMAHTPEDLVQKPHNYAIVDEVDSVLIDDARTPLIISGATPQGDRHEFNELRPIVDKLEALQRHLLTGVLAEAKKLISDGNTKDGGFLLYRVFRGLPKNKALIKFLSQEGMKALLQKTEGHFMQDNNREMPKVDEGLYFVIDEKNNSIELTEKGITYLSGDSKDDDFFVLPDISVELGKIDDSKETPEKNAELKEELYRDFSIKSERIHTLNQLLKAYTLFEKDVEYVLIDGKVKIVDEQTGRIMEGRRYSDGLHQAIEAKENVNIEAATQTYATVTLQNYFRMYRKLSGMTGTAVTEAGEFWKIYKLDVMEIPTNMPLIRKDKEDLVYKTKREKYNAVIDEISDLVSQNRPVLVGTTSVEISELLSRMLKIRKIDHNVLNAKLHKKEAEIVGTERHDSRRVDRQLRGRSGRQGDPGSTQFYVSLEDNLMRLFGSEKIAKMMDRLGLKDGEVIQHSMITKSIERAQRKVEENNFGIRKRLLEYDDIMNAQREVVYKRRRHALYGERLQVDIVNMIYDTCEVITEDNKGSNDYNNFEFELIRNFSFSSPITKEEFLSMSIPEITGLIYEKVYKHYQEKMERNAEMAYPVIKNVYLTEGERYERIVVPFTDGIKEIQVVTNLKQAYYSKGKELVRDFEKNITLAIIDEAWKDHLRQMDELKQSVQNATYEQKDPLIIYKFEAFELFKDLMDKMNKEVISFLFKGELPSQNPNQVSQARARKRDNVQLSKEEVHNLSEGSMPNQTQELQVVETIVRTERKIGRNEHVTIKNVMSGENKSLKYKQAIPLIEKGEWVLTVED